MSDTLANQLAKIQLNNHLDNTIMAGDIERSYNIALTYNLPISSHIVYYSIIDSKISPAYQAAISALEHRSGSYWVFS